ncbi:MAG: hypothetical protein K6T26_06955, partial [Alicyclobacillus sp.]|nr:hypothetical protein [Alicyclobacillus sp.]
MTPSASASSLSMMPAISKILWLRDNLPSLYNQTWKFASMQDMILRQLGIPYPPMDYSDASAFGCFDIRNRVWAGELIDELG